LDDLAAVEHDNAVVRYLHQRYSLTAEILTDGARSRWQRQKHFYKLFDSDHFDLKTILAQKRSEQVFVSII
jgi:hypothetical protein